MVPFPAPEKPETTTRTPLLMALSLTFKIVYLCKSAAAGGGAVEVTISGKREVTKVKLAEEVVDPDDIEMLEDLIVAATNEALRKVEQENQAVMSKLTGGLGGLGGGLPF